MTILITALLVLLPTNLDLPPEGIFEPATVSATAERGAQVQVTETMPPPIEVLTTTPDALNAPSFANNCAEMHWYRVSAGLPARFDALGWRESNCRNEDRVRTSCCHGWWQLNVGLHLRDHRLAPRYRACGVTSYTDVNSDTPNDKRRQACAAKALFDVVGFSAWSTS